MVLDTSISRAVRISKRGFEELLLFMNWEDFYNERLNELDTDPSSVLRYIVVNPEQFY